jgi:hypothetical protein
MIFSRVITSSLWILVGYFNVLRTFVYYKVYRCSYLYLETFDIMR